MGYTSSAVKRKYNKKTYSNWTAAVRKEDFAKIEEVREKTGLSRTQFIKSMIKEVYGVEI